MNHMDVKLWSRNSYSTVPLLDDDDDDYDGDCDGDDSDDSGGDDDNDSVHYNENDIIYSVCKTQRRILHTSSVRESYRWLLDLSVTVT